MIRLIVSDLDGTLCDEAHGLDTITASYIKKLQQAGLTFIMATGRDYSIVEPLFQMFDFRCPVMALNGSVFYDDQGQRILEHKLNRAAANEIAALVKDENLVIWYTAKGNYCAHHDRYYGMIRDVMKDDHLHARFLKEHGYVKFNDTLNISQLLQDDCIYKVDVFHCSLQTYEKLKLVPDIQLSCSSTRGIEITARGITKGYAVKTYCEEQHFRKEEVLTFGDHENDLEMLQAFPYGHIMRNAKEELLEQVNYIAPDHTRHGVIRVIENFTNIPIEGDCI